MTEINVKSALLGVMVATAMALAGCETLTKNMMSDDDIKGATAGVLGVQPNEVTLSDKREQDGVTYYVATIKDGTYACTLTGGSIWSMGVYATPKCNKKDSK